MRQPSRQRGNRKRLNRVNGFNKLNKLDGGRSARREGLLFENGRTAPGWLQGESLGPGRKRRVRSRILEIPARTGKTLKRVETVRSLRHTSLKRGVNEIASGFLNGPWRKRCDMEKQLNMISGKLIQNAENAHSLWQRTDKDNVVKIQFTIRPELSISSGHLGRNRACTVINL